MNETAASSGCRQCRAEQPHCHGTLVHHWGQRAHCTEPGCDPPEVMLHSLRVDCEAIGCPCSERDTHRVAV